MQRYIILFFVILLCKSIVAKAENVFSLPIPSLIQRLDKVLDAKESYVQQKVQRIDSLKKQLFLCNSLDEKYMVTTRLVMEYRSYICDSAMKYVDENWKIAQQTRDSDQLNETKFLEANL